VSDFLVNLARRSAGLTPVARSRSMLPGPALPAGVDAASSGGAAPARSRGLATAAPDRVPHDSGAADRLATDGNPPRRRELSRGTAAVPSDPWGLGPERLPRQETMTPEAARHDAGGDRARKAGPSSPPLAAIESASPATRPGPDIRLVPRTESTGVLPSPAASAEVTVEANALDDLPRRPAAAHFRARPTALEPPVDVSGPDHPGRAASEERAGRSATLEPVRPRAAVESSRRNADLPRAGALEPLPASRPSRLPVPEAVPQRQIDVRIGTIEIIGSEPAPRPLPPAPAAAPASLSLPGGGFDDFVRLRTYSPWTR
jgi:hypothetical protein